MWLEVDAAAFDIVAYMVAVFFGGEPRDSEFAAVDAQPRNVHGFRRCGICDLNDLLKVFVGLRRARARVSLTNGQPGGSQNVVALTRLGRGLSVVVRAEPMSTLDAELNDFGAQLAMLGAHAADCDG